MGMLFTEGVSGYINIKYHRGSEALIRHPGACRGPGFLNLIMDSGLRRNDDSYDVHMRILFTEDVSNYINIMCYPGSEAHIRHPGACQGPGFLKLIYGFRQSPE